MIKALKFIFLAVPGGFLVLFGPLLLAGTQPVQFRAILLSILAVVAGFLMTLYGIGRWGQWRYGLVFLTLIVSLGVMSILPFSILSPFFDVIFAIVPTFIVAGKVRDWYDNAAASAFLVRERFTITGRGTAVVIAEKTDFPVAVTLKAVVYRPDGSTLKAAASKELVLQHKPEAVEREAFVLRDVALGDIPEGCAVEIIR